MTDLDLRPLSLGEILDRAFSMYRSHWILFVGISAVPQVITLAYILFNPLSPQLRQQTITPGSLDVQTLAISLIASLVYLVVIMFALLFAQGGTTVAVSELYLGRKLSITDALKQVWAQFGSLVGMLILYSLRIFLGLILLIVPGIYWLCRLLVAFPVAMIEKTGPGATLRRSFALTKGFAGRAFAILLLSIVLTVAAQALFGLPFRIPLAAAVNDPSALRFWLEMSQIGNTIAGVLVGPIALIANSIFYYDLRVRKEAFDLQFMMSPESQRPPDADGMPSIVA